MEGRRREHDDDNSADENPGGAGVGVSRIFPTREREKPNLSEKRPVTKHTQFSQNAWMWGSKLLSKKKKNRRKIRDRREGFFFSLKRTERCFSRIW